MLSTLKNRGISQIHVFENNSNGISRKCSTSAKAPIVHLRHPHSVLGTEKKRKDGRCRSRAEENKIQK